jgi:hypothetical protein
MSRVTPAMPPPGGRAPTPPIASVVASGGPGEKKWKFEMASWGSPRSSPRLR